MSDKKAKEQNRRFIKVDVFDPAAGDYVHVGLLAYGPNGKNAFIYHDSYQGVPLDPVNLNYRKKGRLFLIEQPGALPGVLQDAMPGHFGTRAIIAENPEYAMMSEADRLYYLGPRTAGGLRFRMYQGPGEEVPIRGWKLLDKIRDRSVRFAMGQEMTLLTDETRYSLLNSSGARPKAEFETPTGERVIAKFNRPDDPHNMARVEAAMNAMAQAAGIDAVESRVERLPSGNDVLLVRRYDHTDAGARIHRMSFTGLTGIDNSEKKNIGKGDFLDLAKTLREVSTDPETDVEELYRRMMFHAAINNVDNHFRNFEIMLTTDGYRLAPSYDTLPDCGRAPVATTMCRYAMPELDSRFVEHTARQMAIPLPKAKQIAYEVMSVVAQTERFFDEFGVNIEDRMLLRGGMKIVQAERLAQALEAQIPPQAARRASLSGSSGTLSSRLKLSGDQMKEVEALAEGVSRMYDRRPGQAP